MNQIYNCKRDKHGNPEFPTNLNEMPTDREAFDGWCFDVGINDPELRDQLYREMRSKEPDAPTVVGGDE